MPITHAKVSAKSDGADATQIQPSDWNDEHVGATGAESPLVLTSNDPAEIPLTLVPDAAQTEALLVVQNEAAGEAVEAFANGSINQYLTDPAVIGWLIKMAADQTASPLRITDSLDLTIFDFDPVNGNIAIKADQFAGTAHSDWYAQSFAGYSETDLLMRVNNLSAGDQKIEMDIYGDANTPANNYTHVVVTFPAEQTTLPVLDLVNGNTGFHAFRILPSGAVGFFNATPAEQQTIDAPNATPEDIANILIAYGLAVQSP